MTKIFEKLDIVLILRAAGLFLFTLYLIQSGMNAGRGAGVGSMLLIFLVGIANGLFQPLVLISLAEIIKSRQAK